MLNLGGEPTVASAVSVGRTRLLIARQVLPQVVPTVCQELSLPVDPRGQFTGREHDATGLYSYRARYYHSALSRFVSEDPIAFEAGDANFYAYVGNSPVAYIDPLGLAAEICCRPLKRVGTVTRLRHCYIRTDGGTYGLYPENGLGIPRLNHPDDTGGICKPCLPMKCGDPNHCIDNAHRSYPIGTYRASGPNSNTYAGTIARSCCQGGMPSGLGVHPGSDMDPPRPIPRQP